MALITHLLLSFSVLTAHLWQVTESIKLCKHYPNPKNGRVVCDSLFRLFCTPECDEGFVFESRPAVVYMCGPLTGAWFTYPEGEEVPWPDCITKKGSSAPHHEDNMANRREQINQKIQNTHSALFPQKYQMRTLETDRPDARYLHLFDYIQRAQQVYHNKQMDSLGYGALERQRQFVSEKQQKRQGQLQINRLRQKSMQQAQRPVRQSIDSLITGQRQNVPQSPSTAALWKDVAEYHISRTRQSNRASDSLPTSSGRATVSHYSKVPQVLYQRYYSPSHFPKQAFTEQQSHLDSSSRFLVALPKHIGPLSNIQSSQTQSRVTERNKTPPNERQVSLIAVPLVAKPTSRRSHLSRILSNSNQEINKLQYEVNSQTQSDNKNAAPVTYYPSNKILASDGEPSLINRSWTSLPKPYTLLSRNQLQVGDQSKVSLKSESTQAVLIKTVETQVKPFLVKSTGHAVQTLQKGQPPNRISSHLFIITPNTHGQSNMTDWQNDQSWENTTKKEKLFYFPIKRDTLIQMLPLNLQEKYKSLRETRNSTLKQYDNSGSNNSANQAGFGRQIANGPKSIN